MAQRDSAQNLAFRRRIAKVHNHHLRRPDAVPCDIEMTKQVVDAATPLGIAIDEHIIIGKDGHVCLKGLKLM